MRKDKPIGFASVIAVNICKLGVTTCGEEPQDNVVAASAVAEQFPILFTMRGRSNEGETR